MKPHVIAAALVATLTSASAADLSGRPYTKAPPPAVAAYNWSGIYIGADVGYGWGRSSGSGNSSIPVPSNATPYGFDTSGVVGGGYVGANYQFSQIVVGVEADWQASNVNGDSGLLFAANGFGPYNFRTAISDYGSVRGRLGVAFDRVLLFGTGGWAWGSYSTAYGNSGQAPFYTNNANARGGWTVGAGAEYALANNWIGRVEYRYTDLGSSSFVAGTNFIPPNSSEAGNRVTVNDVRIGIAYKFGGPFTP